MTMNIEQVKSPSKNRCTCKEPGQAQVPHPLILVNLIVNY